MTSNSNAAARLQGLNLNNGWKVVSPVVRKSGSSGGNCSNSYIAEKDGKKAFLKAMDLSEALSVEEDTLDFIRMLTDAYHHEREVLRHCKDKRMSKVVVAIDHGEVQVPGLSGLDGRVFYLIFEMADGDVRGQVDISRRFDTLWSLRALKDVCLGLWQVHRELIAHQDTKPSNVLVYKSDGFRVGDFGRSSREGRSLWYDAYPIAGDPVYAPPELLYRDLNPNFAARRIGCDMYMFGNLVAFMFAGVNITAAIAARLPQQFHWHNWGGSYRDVLEYVNHAFSDALNDLASDIDPDVRNEVLQMIRELSHPDVNRRGFPKAVGRLTQYSLERYVSRLHLLAQKADLKRRIRGRA
jgi:eukaryotic-like serine/threonine-protein kinase